MAIAASIDIEAGVQAGLPGAGRTVLGKAPGAAALGASAQSSGTGAPSFRSSWQSMLETLGASLDGAEPGGAESSLGADMKAAATGDGGAAALAARAKSATATSASSFASAAGLPVENGAGNSASDGAIGERAGLRTSGSAGWSGSAAQVARQAARSEQADSSGQTEKTDASDGAHGAAEGKSSDWKKKSSEDAQGPAASANAPAPQVTVASLSQMPVPMPVQTPVQAAPKPAAEWSQKSLTLAGSALASSSFGSSGFGVGKDIVPGLNTGSGATAAVAGTTEKETSRAEHGHDGVASAASTGAERREPGLTAQGNDGIRSAAALAGNGISTLALPASAGGDGAEIGHTAASAHSAMQKPADSVSAAGSAVASAGLGADANSGVPAAQANGTDDAASQLQGALAQASASPGSALPGSAAELSSAAAPKQAAEKRAGDSGTVRAAHGASAGEMDRAVGVTVPVTGAPADAAALGRNPAGGHQAVAGTVVTGGGSAGAAGGTSGQGTFAALDAENGAKASWTHVGPRSAEAGFSDPALGWVGVRADVGAGGVHASVVPGSAEAAQTLGGHMAGLNTFLSGQQSSVATVTLASPGGTGGDGGAGAMQQGTGGGGQGANQGGSPEAQSGTGVLTPSISASAMREVSATGGGLDRLASPFGQSGGHISVMA